MRKKVVMLFLFVLFATAGCQDEIRFLVVDPAKNVAVGLKEAWEEGGRQADKPKFEKSWAYYLYTRYAPSPVSVKNSCSLISNVRKDFLEIETRGEITQEAKGYRCLLPFFYNPSTFGFSSILIYAVKYKENGKEKIKIKHYVTDKFNGDGTDSYFKTKEEKEKFERELAEAWNRKIRAHLRIKALIGAKRETKKLVQTGEIERINFFPLLVRWVRVQFPLRIWKKRNYDPVWKYENYAKVLGERVKDDMLQSAIIAMMLTKAYLAREYSLMSEIAKEFAHSRWF